MARARVEVRRLLASGRVATGPVWRSMAASLQRAMLLGLVVWNVVLAIVVLAGDPRITPALLVPLHLALAGLAWAGARERVPFVACLLPGYAVWMLDYLAARSVDDAITLAACWLGNLLYLAPALAATSRARTWLPVIGAVAVSVTIAAVSDVWQIAVSSAFIVTAVAIVVVARAATPSLWGLAEDADRNLRQLEAERSAQEVARRTGAAAAEDARLVHDTVINTLGSVANGAASRHDQDRMRERCRSDLLVVEAIVEGRREPGRRHLADIGRDAAGLRVVRTGLDGPALQEIEEILSSETLEALVGAADEAVRNAEKHAGVDEVHVDARRLGNEVVVVVVDRGDGFVADLAAAAGHGIARSMLARMRAVGGGVTVSSRPGGGTRVRIGAPIAPALAPSSGNGVASTPVGAAEVVARALLRRACWLLGAGIVAVGFLIEATNRPGQLTWTYAMLGLIGSGIALAHRSSRDGRLLGIVVTLLVLGLPVGFVASMAGIDFGRTQAMTYQAIGIVPFAVVLIVLGHRRAAVWACSLLAATAVAVAGVVSVDSTTRAAVVLVGALPALGLAIGWIYFEGLVLRIVTRSEQARSQAEAAATEVASRLELEAARRRWGTASLTRAADLLRGIAEGHLDVDAAQVREECSIEERHLRQLLLLDPTAFRITGWFAGALAAARARGVLLTIRGGDQDVASGDEAEALGRLLIAAVDAAPPGADVSVGWFPSTDGQRLLIVGPQICSDDVAVPDLPSSWRCGRTDVADRSMLEVTVA